MSGPRSSDGPTAVPRSWGGGGVACGSLRGEPRRALHARIAAALEGQFAEIVENQPEILARHCTEAGLIEKAAGLWGKAGQRSLARSALAEGAAQLARAL